MYKFVYKLVFLICIVSLQTTVAGEYKVPPSTSTAGNVPYISDKAMEACVELYNQALWLKTKIDNTQVDVYSQSSVDSYNNNVNRHSNMINKFNRNCAGKQSYSAWKAAQKLNNR